MRRFAFLLLLLAGGPAHAQLSPMIPSQLQIPATGVDFNNLIQQINLHSIVNSSQSSNPVLSISSTPSGLAPTAIVNGFTFFGGPTDPFANASTLPYLAATGLDTNIDLGLFPKGTGAVQFVNANNWLPATGLALCPGSGSVPLGPSIGSRANTNTITGFLVVNDWMDRPHGIPVCW